MSFFGFDTSNPPPKKGKASKVGNHNGSKGKGANKKSEQNAPTQSLQFDGDALDALLEQRYSNGLELGPEDEDYKTSMLLQNDNVELNDETFGIELEDGDFDFGNQPVKQTLLSSSMRQHPSQLSTIPQSVAHQRPTSGYPKKQPILSLDQVEAQMRGGGRSIPPNGIPLSYSNQPNSTMNGGLMNRPPISQMPPPMMNQMFGGGGMPMRPSSMMPTGPFNQPTSQQAFMMRPPPQMSHSFQPPHHPHMMPSHPQPIVIDGISVTPVEISNQEKDMIFAKLQVIQPMFMHIDTLMNTIHKIGGDKESENLRRLNDVKNILRAQLELINRGIFVMRHDTVLQVHGSLLQFFQYGESLMKNSALSSAAAAETVQTQVSQRPLSPKRSPEPRQASPRQPSPQHISPQQISPKRASATLNTEGIDGDQGEVISSVPEGEPSSRKLLKVIKKKKEVEKSEEVPAIKFDENDFPALGQLSIQHPSLEGKEEGKGKEPVIRIAARGNQKQRREERQKLERMGVASLLEHDSTLSLEELSIPREERYNGLMRKHEKELIAKIQISQLVSDDPFKDDYYFQMRSLSKNKEQEQEGSVSTPLGGISTGGKSGGGKMKKKGAKWQISAGQLVQGKTGAALSNQMQQQMKRLIESRRALKPREGNLSLEGALGKIAVKSNRAPKQALEVAPPSSSEQQLLSNTLSSMADFKCAENIFDAVLALEEFNRKKGPEKGDGKEKWLTEKTNLVNQLWRCMAPSDDIPLTTPHPLVCSLNHVKGLQAASRGLSLLDTKQCLGFFSIMFKRLECLNVCNYTLGAESEKVEMFMTHILPVFTAIISEAEMGVLLVLMRIVLERHNLVWLASCRVGLVLLTMILSRAEMVKQNIGVGGEEDGGGESGVNDAESSMWEEIYSFLFSSFQGQFSELFKVDTTPDDQVYVWQFLSAMAVGASGIEQQKILVTEMRENIIQTAKTNHPKALENVNLFLNALGLNITASQLAAMSG